MAGGLGPKALTRGVSSEIACVVPFVKDVFDAHNIPCMLTSITDRTHGKGSLHYTGNAIDILWSDEWGVVPSVVEYGLFLALNGYPITKKDRIPPEYDIVFEEDHFHIEFQPKVSPFEYQKLVAAAGY